MADPLSVAAGILGLATAGAKLSLTFFDFASQLGSAGKDINMVAEELTLFGQVYIQAASRPQTSGGYSRYPD